jgi:nuclear GTP-binding protein
MQPGNISCIPLCGFASVYEPGVCHGSSIAPPPQGIQTERNMECNRCIFGFPNVSKSSLINMLNRAKFHELISGLSPVEKILAWTQTERLMKIYNLLRFSLTLKFLTMLALSTGRLLKVSLSPSLLQNSKKKTFLSHRVAPRRHPFCGMSCPHRLEAPKNPVLLRVACAACHAGQAQIVKALNVPFVLEGLFG